MSEVKGRKIKTMERDFTHDTNLTGFYSLKHRVSCAKHLAINT